MLMHPTTSLRLVKEPKMDNTQYRAMIGSLLHLTASISNITFSVCLCARFQKDPREVHLIVIKRVFRYLIGTPNLGLCFKKRKEFKLISYCDVDYIVEAFTSLVETQSLRSTSSCCTQLIQIMNQLEDYNIFENNISIYCDNKVTISLSKNPTLHSRAKHIEINHHFLRDHVQKGTMDLHFVPTINQLVDICTKPHTEERMILLRNQLGIDYVKE